MEARARELLRYARFDEADARRLAAFAARAKPHLPGVADEFYERIREHEAAHAVLSDEEQIARLRGTMVGWLEGLFGGVYDGAYFAGIAQVGRAHVRVGLPHRYVPAAMAQVRSALSTIIDREGGVDAAATRDALSRLLDVQLAVMLESYCEMFVARIERAAQADREALSRRITRAEQRCSKVVELAHVLVVGLDARGEILLFNHEAERSTGWARDEVLGRSVHEVFGDANALPKSGEGESEAEIVTRAGRRRRIAWQVASVPRGDEADFAAVLIGRDTTDEHAERTRRAQAERLAAVGALAAGLAHEIRNPLNGAQLHVAYLERSLSGGAARAASQGDALEAVHVVRAEIQRLARLVTDFLDFARPAPLERVDTAVRQLCEGAARAVGEEAEKAGVTLAVDMPKTDIVLSADRNRLERVLGNLLHNAIEALAPDGGNVTVRARREPRDVVIDVEDDGPGLPAGEPPIFDAFWSTKADGTGLGLSIVHRIVTDHGGRIEVESRPGRTRFRLRIPFEAQGTELR